MHSKYMLTLGYLDIFVEQHMSLSTYLFYPTVSTVILFPLNVHSLHEVDYSGD